MADVQETKKLCPRCGDVLDINMFLTRSGRLQCYCRPCRQEDQRERTYGYIEHKPTHCQICKVLFTQKRPACLDHNHATNVIRGWLCKQCNSGLGQFQDSIDNLLSAVEYLKATATNTDVINPVRSGDIEKPVLPELTPEDVPEGMQKMAELVKSFTK